MTNNKNHIPYPAGDDKEKSIKLIVASGMPEQQRLSAALPKIYRYIGFRGLFFGVGECVFLTVVASILLWLSLLSTINDNTTFLYAIFMASPFMYAALHLLTTWKEIMSGTYEYMMSCRCSLRQLTVLRMLVFGGVCVLGQLELWDVVCSTARHLLCGLSRHSRNHLLSVEPQQ